jgi:hypothetical protein
VRKNQFDEWTYFEYDEIDLWGNHIWHNSTTLENTDFQSIKKLDEIRSIIGLPITLHCAYQNGGHSSKSMHYRRKNTAIDFSIKGKGTYLEKIAHVCNALDSLGYARTCGLGIYPDWLNPGFHLDHRGEKKRWGALFENGKQAYYGFEYVLAYVVEKNK